MKTFRLTGHLFTVLTGLAAAVMLLISFYDESRPESDAWISFGVLLGVLYFAAHGLTRAITLITAPKGEK